jgi:hypothetical protein
MNKTGAYPMGGSGIMAKPDVVQNHMMECQNLCGKKPKPKPKPKKKKTPGSRVKYS